MSMTKMLSRGEAIEFANKANAVDGRVVDTVVIKRGEDYWVKQVPLYSATRHRSKLARIGRLLLISPVLFPIAVLYVSYFLSSSFVKFLDNSKTLAKVTGFVEQFIRG